MLFNNTYKYKSQLFQSDDKVDRLSKKPDYESMKNLLLAAVLCLTACETGSGPQMMQLEAKKAELRKIANADKTKGNYSGASAVESQIISLEIDKPETFISLSNTLHKQGNKAESLDVLQTGEKLMPDNEKLKLASAIETIENNRPEEGIAKLATIKTLKNRDYYNALGVANDLIGKHDVAQDAFEDGLEVVPDDGLLLNNLALSYILDKDYNEAIKILKELVSRPDAKPKYRQNLALAYGMTAKPEEAMKLLLKDMPKKDAEENLKSYKQMREEKKK